MSSVNCNHGPSDSLSRPTTTLLIVSCLMLIFPAKKRMPLAVSSAITTCSLRWIDYNYIMPDKILIIEDEPSIAENIIYALNTEGYEPHWYTSGKEALEFLSLTPISLAIIDIGLPDMNGFDLFREMRKDSDVPIIFLTARSDEIDRVAGLEMGADDYVVKPFSPRELTARVRTVLRRAGVQEPGPDYSKKAKNIHFQIDELRHLIRYYDKELVLTRYEYRLLKLLIENPGRVFERNALMERIWEEPGMSIDRTVDTHIKTIRQKLHAIMPDIDPIVTHRGIGYSLKADA